MGSLSSSRVETTVGRDVHSLKEVGQPSSETVILLTGHGPHAQLSASSHGTAPLGRQQDSSRNGGSAPYWLVLLEKLFKFSEFPLSHL